MAKARVSIHVLEEMVFGFSAHAVSIRKICVDEDLGVVVFEIVGPDVPDASEVIPTMNRQQNRAGQRLMTMTFQPVTK